MLSRYVLRSKEGQETWASSQVTFSNSNINLIFELLDYDKVVFTVKGKGTAVMPLFYLDKNENEQQKPANTSAGVKTKEKSKGGELEEKVYNFLILEKGASSMYHSGKHYKRRCPDPTEHRRPSSKSKTFFIWEYEIG